MERAAGPAAVIATTPDFFRVAVRNIGKNHLITKGFCRLGYLLCTRIKIYYVICKNSSF